MRVIANELDPHTHVKRPARHLKTAGRQKLHEKSTHNPWLKLSERSKSAKEIRTACKMRPCC